MKKIVFSFVLITLLCHSSPAEAQEKSWTIDQAHSTIGFSAEFMNVSTVSGKFREYSVAVTTDGNDFAGADIRVSIDVRSIDTDNDLRDKDLLSENFLYAGEYPKISFENQTFRKTSEDTYEMQGDLTIREVTREESFHVISKGVVSDGDTLRAGFSVEGSIDRFDYNVDWNKVFGKGFVVSEKVGIQCNVTLLRVK